MIIHFLSLTIFFNLMTMENNLTARHISPTKEAFLGKIEIIQKLDCNKPNLGRILHLLYICFFLILDQFSHR